MYLVILMKNRAELFSIFQKFYTEIQTQFNISIRVLKKKKKNFLIRESESEHASEGDEGES